jgi:MoaA/NifB/PqqE/SkfB family radical SAM enzyme
MRDSERIVMISINDRCPLRCRHCSVGYGEENKGSNLTISEDKLIEIIKAVDPAVYTWVLLTGGEPSLAPHLVKTAIEMCHRKGLRTTVTSSPVWAETDSKVKIFLEKVSGLDCIYLSFDAFHLEQIPLEQYERAATMSAQAGIQPLFMIGHHSEEEKQRLFEMVAPLGFQVGYTNLLPVGNAKDLNIFEGQGISLEFPEDFDRLKRTCMAGNPFVDLSGKMFLCCWSAGVANPPFLGTAQSGLEYFMQFLELEAAGFYSEIKVKGIISSLPCSVKRNLITRTKGLTFLNECHFCMWLMDDNDGRTWLEIFETTAELEAWELKND